MINCKIRFKIWKSDFLATMKPNSFTLIELVIVIGILAVLAAVVVIVINPAEYMKSTRDSQRMSELQTITKSIELYLGDGGSSMGSANTVYVSIPDSSTTCANLGLPSLPGGWSYSCSTSANYRKTDGTGWIPIPFSTISFGNTLDALPIDPVNATSTGNYYTYVTGGSFELTAIFESSKYRNSNNSQKGFPGVYALGSNLTLSPIYNNSGLVGYWTFEDGSGSNIIDYSNTGNNGTWFGSGTHWTTASKIGSYAGLFNIGNADYITLPTLSLNSISIAMWINLPVSFGQVYNPLIYLFDSSSNGVAIRITDNSYAELLVRSSNTVVVDKNFTPAFGNYSHVVVVVDTNTQTASTYINGIKTSSSTSFSGTLPVTYTNNQLGHSNGCVANNYSTINGLDDVRIYNRALSTSEISALYNSTR